MLNEEKKWYEKAGKESDVVISTRVRLARNLADMPFPNRMTPDQKAAVERRVRDAILSGNSAIASDFDFVQMDDLSNEQAVSLVNATSSARSSSQTQRDADSSSQRTSASPLW